MTEQHETFCREYVVDFNAAAAARRAGYSSGYAVELMRREDIRERIALLLPDPGDGSISIPRDGGRGMLYVDDRSEARIQSRSLKVICRNS